MISSTLLPRRVCLVFRHPPQRPPLLPLRRPLRPFGPFSPQPSQPTYRHKTTTTAPASPKPDDAFLSEFSDAKSPDRTITRVIPDAFTEAFQAEEPGQQPRLLSAASLDGPAPPAPPTRRVECQGEVKGPEEEIKSQKKAPRKKKGPRLWKRVGGHIAATEDVVGVTTLGKPSDALIVKAHGTKTSIVPKKKKPKTPVEVDSEGTEKLIQHNRFDATVDEILRNITELQPPKGEREVSQKKYDALLNLLNTGFTRSQIETYIKNFSPDAEDFASRPAWIVSFPQYAPFVARRKTTKIGLTKKSALIVHIVTDLWGVVLEDARAGYLDIRYRDVEFGLLFTGTRRVLNFMAKYYLKHGGQLEAFQKTNTIRIVAPRKEAYLIMRELDDLLSEVRSGTISYKDLPEPPTQEMIDMLAKITNAFIQRNTKKQQLVVHWMHLSHRPEQLEILCQTVHRLLLGAMYMWPRSSSSLLVCPEAEGSGTRHIYLEPSYDNEKLTWHRRLGHWVRWTSELRVGTEDAEPATPAPVPVLEDALVKDWKLCPADDGVNFPTPVPYGSSGWSTAPETCTKATFGQVLFQRSPGDMLPPAPKISPTATTRLLAPVTPPLTSLTELPSTVGGDNTIILIRFLPWSPTGSVNPEWPPLELALKINETEVLGPASFRAILADRTTDILLPNAPVDARVYQNRHVHLSPANLESNPEIAKFLKDCVLNIEKGSLAAPSRAMFSIPRRLHVENGKEKPGSNSPQDSALGSAIIDDSRISIEPGAEDEVVEVDYVFMGMELQRSVVCKWLEGTAVTYTSIEGGQGGGRRAEFSLTAIQPAEETGAKVLETLNAPGGTPQQGFLKLVHSVATGESFPWIKN